MFALAIGLATDPDHQDVRAVAAAQREVLARPSLKLLGFILLLVSGLASGVAEAHAQRWTVRGLAPVFEAAKRAAETQADPSRVLLVLDIDNTTLWKMAHPLDNDWYARFLDAGWESDRIGRFNETLAEYPHFPTDPHFAHRLDELASMGVRHVFVTARTDLMVPRTERALGRFHLLGQPGGLALPTRDEEIRLPVPVPLTRGEHVLFRNGVLYVGSFDKARALDSLHATLGLKPPEHLLVADDKDTQLDSFEKVYGEKRLELFRVQFDSRKCSADIVEAALSVSAGALVGQ